MNRYSTWKSVYYTCRSQLYGICTCYIQITAVSCGTFMAELTFGWQHESNGEKLWSLFQSMPCVKSGDMMKNIKSFHTTNVSLCFHEWEECWKNVHVEWYQLDSTGLWQLKACRGGMKVWHKSTKVWICFFCFQRHRLKYVKVNKWRLELCRHYIRDGYGLSAK